MFTSMVYNTDAYELAKQIVYKSGILTMLRDDDDPDNANRIENIEELLNGIQEFCETEDNITPENNEGEQAKGMVEIKTLDMFLQQVLLMTSEDKEKDDGNKVSLMTIHAAKGLEFPYVYVTGMEENMFPSFMSISSRQELEEERRLFYVAVTRAEKQLTLSYAMTRYQHGSSSCQEVSRFVEEIDSRYLDEPKRAMSGFPRVGELPRAFFNVGKPQPAAEPKHFKKVTPEHHHYGPAITNTPEQVSGIQAGVLVHHAKFGNGKVLTVEGTGGDAKATVFFEGVGQKQLLLKYAKLTILG